MMHPSERTTVADAQEKLHGIEQDIAAMLTAYSAATGVLVAGVEVSIPARTIGKVATPVYRVTVEAHL